MSEAWPLYYNDLGCNYAPSCLNCPFAACRHDDPAAFRDREVPRRRRISQDSGQGYKVAEIALREGISTRSVYRRLAKLRAPDLD